jgi:hypothetical protein
VLDANLRTILNELATGYRAQADAIGVPRLAVIRWLRPSTGVRSTAHARLIIEALAKVRPVTAEDWQAVCAEPWAAPKETP